MYSQEVGALGHGDKKHHFTPKKVEFFEKNNIKIKWVSAGLYHTCALATTGELYTWGRGLYGVLGNASNQYSLEPELNDELNILKQEDPIGKEIIKLDSADEYTAVLMRDGSLYVWGKNDRGQMGTGSGIGIDMVESENQPTLIPVIDKDNKPQLVKDVHTGQNTMMIMDEHNNVYKTGLKLDYSPNQIDLPSDFSKEDI